MTKPGSFLGRGYDDIAGQPFGYAYYRERDEIRDHLERRGFDQSGVLGPNRLEARITVIQQRIHRNRPTLRERQQQRPMIRRAPAPTFTTDELNHLADIFANANDPLSASIGVKARAILDAR